MDDSEIIKLWEDAIGDSGEAPTDAELCDFARAVRAQSLEEAAVAAGKNKRWQGLMRVSVTIFLRGLI